MADNPQSLPLEAPPPTWSPLRLPVFRMLWITWVTSNICMWMNDVAAAWLMISLTTSPVMIALVQTASTLPVLLLGVPSGALADILNRRSWYLSTQVWVAVNAVVLSIAVLTGVLSAPLLLALTFSNGIGLAMRWPVYAAIIPELVPRRELQSAIALNAIAMNGSRIIGPIVAGALLATVGGAYVFLLNAALSIFAGVVIWRWRTERKASVLPGERFVGAMRVGLQYVGQSPALRVVLLRVALFFLQSTPLLALLPLVAKHMEGGGAGGAGVFTTLLASLGLGAISAALWLPRIRVLITRDRLLRDGSLLQAAGMVAVGFAPNLYVAIPAMIIAGAAWITVVNTLTVAAQLELPDWVRARGMSIYQMALMGATSISAALWGKVADLSDVQWTFVFAAVAGIVGLVATRGMQVGPAEGIDLTPARILKEPTPAFPIEHDRGPVMVTIEYLIDPARAEEFKGVMRESRANRLQKGALSWGLFHDTSEPGRYVEYFLDESWAEHLRRFDRMTAADIELRDRRQSFHIGPQPPKVSRYVAEPVNR
ncbi:MAG TPA: MFS transporter [Burkholderiaceae bacterium]|nr:MFS transporter [Burkholderiaceae bacterium]